MEKVIIIGGKGTAVVIAEQIYDAKIKFGVQIEILGFAFDDPLYNSGINGWPVLCGTKEVYSLYKEDEDVKFVFGMYRSDLIEERIKLRDSYGIPKHRFLSFIHPSVSIVKSAKLGYGNIILANSTINSNVTIGDFNTIQANTIIEHDTIIGNSNFIAAHTVIGSSISIGDGNFAGLNCSIRNYTRIGNYNLIGMASNVINDVDDYNVVIGNPARFLRSNGKI